MSKTRRTAKPQKPPITPLTQGQHTIPVVSNDHQLLVGRVVVLWSKLEGAMQDTTWSFLRIGISDGRILTGGMQAESLLRILRALGNRHLKEPILGEFLSMMDLIQDRQEDRNFIVHGTWGTLMPNNVPIGLSLRPKSTPGQVIGETFSRERMSSIAQDLLRCLTYLATFLPQLAAMSREPDEEQSEGT
jgi:hypothetical protein